MKMAIWLLFGTSLKLNSNHTKSKSKVQISKKLKIINKKHFSRPLLSFKTSLKSPFESLRVSIKWCTSKKVFKKWMKTYQPLAISQYCPKAKEISWSLKLQNRKVDFLSPQKKLHIWFVLKFSSPRNSSFRLKITLTQCDPERLKS